MIGPASTAAARRTLFATFAVLAALAPAVALSQQTPAPAPAPAAGQKQAAQGKGAEGKGADGKGATGKGSEGKGSKAKGSKGRADQGPPKLDASAWILIDPRDDTVLASKRPNAHLPIASTTKLMTAHLALEKLSPKRKLRAVPYQALATESLLGLRAGERMTVRDLLYALVLPSANDAAETLAEGVSGSIPKFVNQMNREAAALGLDDTSYANPVGLDSPDNYSSAADLAALASVLLEEPLFAQIADTQSTTLRSGDRPRAITSRNTLLARDPSADGVKTGHTAGAGYVLVGSATRDGTRLVSAVLGAKSEAARDSESLRLLDYGFSRYKPARPVKRGDELADPKLDYRDDRLPLVAQRQVEVSARKGQAIETRVKAPDELSGDIEQGEKLGSVVVTVDGRAAGVSPLVAAESAEAATLLDKAVSYAQNPAISLPAGAFVIVVGVLLVAWRRRTRHSDETEPPPEPKPTKPKRRRRDRGPRERTPEERRQMHDERMRRRRQRQQGEQQGEDRP